MSTLPAASNPVSNAIHTLKQRVKPIIIWLSRKLRLTFTPRPERRLARITAMLLMPWVPSLALANPTGGQVVSGQATISQPNNSTVLVNQGSNKAVLDWQKFSIGRGESVIFNQPGASSVALNRVLGADPSQIFGTLKSNGSVFLVNPAGVLFAPGANVSVGGLVGSTLSISNADFNAGNYRFANGGNAGSVINQGSVNANGGYVALLGPKVGNDGQIIANGGSVGFGAGDKVSLSFGASGMVNVNVDAAAAAATINNKGAVQADGGQVQFVARSADALLDTVINNTGTVRANTLVQKDGRIFLDGGSRGVVSNSGGLQTRGDVAGSKGGSITVLGDKVGIEGAAKIDASGQAGGGTVLVGGNYQGKGVESNASYTYVSSQASIKADALNNGDGGKVVVWANEKNTFDGSISARGGAQGGNGGFVETSGKNTLRAMGSVDAGAPAGKGGTWLLDPNNISIDAVGANTNATNTATVFSTTDDSAVVSNDLLGKALTGGTTVKVQTGGAGTNGQSGNITVNSTVTASGAATLNLDAQGSIDFTAAGKIVAAVGNKLNVNLNAGTKSDFTSPGTNVSGITMVNGSQITTNDGNVTATAKTTGIALAGINTGAGNLTVTSNGGNISQNSALTVGGSATLDAGAGSINLASQSNNIANLGAVSATGNVALDNSAATGALTLTGNLSTSGAVSLTNPSGDINFNGKTVAASDLSAKSVSVTLGGANLTGVGGVITLEPSNAGDAISLNGAAAYNLVGGITTLANSGASSIIIGQSGGTGAFTIGGASSFGTKNVTLRAGSFSDGGTTTNTLTAGTLNFVANSGNIGASTSNGALDIAVTNVSATTAGGNAFLNSGSGFNVTASNLGAGTMNLSAGGNISQSGAITADTLTVAATDKNVNFGASSNQISHLGAISLNTGNFTLKNTAAIDQTSGVIDIGTLTLTNTTGGTNFGSKGNLIDHLGAIDASGQTFSLKNNLGLDQTGVIKADTLVLTNTSGTTDFSSQSNQIAHLGAIDASSRTFKLTNAVALSQSGVVKADTFVLTNSGGAVNLGTQDNLISNLGAVSTSNGNFTLKTGAPLTMAGALNAGTGAIDLNTGNNALVVGSNTLTSVGLTTKSSSISLGSATLSVDGTIAVQPFDSTAAISLNASASPATFNLDSASIGKILNANSSDFVVGQAGGTGVMTIGGTANFGSVNNLTLNAGSITNGGNTGRTITANTLTLNANNGSIGASGNSTISIAATKVVANAASAGSGGGVYLTSASGFDVGTSNAGAGTLDLAVTAGSTGLTQLSGVITAGTLNVNNIKGDTDFGGKLNQIGALGTITATGKVFSLQDGVALTQSGVMKAATLNLTNTTAATTLTQANQIGALGTVDASGQTLTLTDTVALVQTGALKADTLAYTNTTASTTLTQSNQILHLGAIDASGQSLSLTNTKAVTLDQTGTLKAGTLVLSTAGGVDLSSQSNQVSNLGAITTAGNFSLKNANAAGTLKLTGAVNAGANDITLNTGTSKLDFASATLTAANLSATSGSVAQTAVNLNAVSTGITLQPSDPTTALSLAGSSAYNIDAGFIAAIKAAGATNIVVGQTGGTGTMTIGAAADFGSTNSVTLNAGAITDGATNSTITASTLTLNANTAHTTGTTGFIGSSAAKDAIDIAVSKVVVNTQGGSAYLTSANGFDVGTTNVGAGTLDLSVSAGSTGLTQSGVITAATLNVSNGKGDTDFSTKVNQIGKLGTVTATGKVFSLQDGVALTQSGVLTAATLNLTNTTASTTLNQANQIGALGSIDASGQTLTLTNAAALTQTGVLKADTLSLTNKAGDTNLGSQNNVIAHLGAVDAGTHIISLQDTVALDQSAALTANTLNLTNTGGATTLSQNNSVTNLGTISNKMGDFTFNNNGSSGKLTLGGNIDASTHTIDLDAGNQMLDLASKTLTASKLVLKAQSIQNGNLGSITGVVDLAPGSTTATVGVGVGSGYNFTVDAATLLTLKNGSATGVEIGRSDSTAATTVAGTVDLGGKPLTLYGGSIANSGSNVITAPSVTLQAGNGAIGSKANPVIVDTTTTTVIATTKGGDAFIKSAGGFAVGKSNVGTGALNLTAGGNLTQSDVITAGTLAVSNTAGNTDFSNPANAIAHLGTIDATGKNFSLQDSVALDQTGVLTANTLTLTNTGGASDLSSQNNKVTNLGTISNTAGDFKFNNGAASATLTLTGDIDASKNHEIQLDAGNNGIDLGSGVLTASKLTIKSTSVANGNFSNFEGAVALTPGAAANTVGLATSSGFDYNVSTATISSLKTGSKITNVTIGRTDSTAAMTVVADADFGTKPLTLNAGSIVDSGTKTITSGALTLKTLSGAIGSSGDAIDIASSAVSITTAGASAYVKSAGGFDVTGANVGSGTLGLSAAGALSQSGAITAGTLSVSNTTGSTDFGGQTNLISHVGTIAASGQAVSLKTSTAALDQTGAITADTLTLTNTTGATDFSGQTNAIGKLGTVSSTAGAFTLNNKGTALSLASINAGSNPVTLDTGSASVNFGASSTITASNLSVTSTGVTQTAGGVTLNTPATLTANGGAIKLDDSGNQFKNTISASNSGANGISLLTKGDLQLGTIDTANDLTLQNSGNVTSGKLTVGGNTALTLDGAGADVTLNTAGNSFAGTLTITNGGGTAHDVKITNAHATPGLLTLPASGLHSVDLNYAHALDLGGTSITGDLTATSGGAITQTKSISVTGKTTLDAGSNNITLADTKNSFTGDVTITKAADVDLGNTGNLSIGGATATNLKLSSSGTISQTGAIKVTGTTTLDVGANAIKLDDSGNNFGLVTLTTGASSISLRDTDSIQLGNISTTGNLTVVANGITQDSNGVKVGGIADLNSGSGAIVLNTAANKVDGVLNLKNTSAQDISFTTGSDLQLGLIDAKQNLAISAQTITQDGQGITVAGTGGFTTGGKDLTLKTAGDKFSGAVSITAGTGNIDLQISNAIKLGTVSTSGKLSVDALGISQDSGGVSVGGTASFNANAAAISLKTAGNDFIGAVSLKNSGANAIDVVDTNAIKLGTVSTSGALSVSAVGITQDATGISASGTSKFTGNGGAVKLDAAANALSGAVSASSNSDVTLTTGGALALDTVSSKGNLALNAGGNVSQTAAASVSGKTDVSISGGPFNVILDKAGNDFTGAISVSGAVTDVSLTNINATATLADLSKATGTLNNLTLDFKNAALDLPTTTVTGKLSVTTGGNLTQSGTLKADSAKFDAGSHAITLKDANNAFANGVSVNNTGSNAVALYGKNGMQLDASKVGGDLEVNVSGALSQAGAVDVGGNLSLTSTGAMTQSAKLTVAGTTTLAAGANDITLNNTGNHFTKDLNITSGKDVTLVDSGAVVLGSDTVSGNFKLNVGGGVTQSAALSVTGTTTVTADTNTKQNIKLDNAGNNLTGAIKIANGSGSVQDVSVANSNATAAVATLPSTGLRNVDLNFSGGDIALAAFDVSGNFTLSAKGNITQSGPLTVTGTTTLNSASGAITLKDVGNDFGGVVKVTSTGANDVALLDKGDISIGNSSSVGQNLDVTASGSATLGAIGVGKNLSVAVSNGVTQNGTLTVGGTTGVTLNSNANQDVSLNDTSNNLTGKVSITNGTGSARDVSITNTAASASFTLPASLRNLSLTQTNGAVDLPLTTLTGSLNVTAGGAITQSGALKVGTTTTLDAAGKSITLSDANNDFIGDVTISHAADATLADKNALQIGGAAITSGLTLSSGGALTQTGAVTVGGITTLDSAAASLTLTHAGNDFAGAVVVNNAGSVSLTDKNALLLGKINTGGNLAVTASGDISENAAAIVGGSTSLTFNSNGNVLLGSQANSLAGKVSVTNGGGNVQNVNLWNTHAGASLGLPASVNDLTLLLPASGIDLPSTAVKGNLNVTTAGAITQAGAITVSGTSTIAAGGNAVTLNKSGNDFFGAVSVSGASDVDLADANALTLGTVTASGNLSAKNTTGDLNLGTSTVGGNLQATASAGNIVQGGALKVSGTSALKANGNSITLTTAGNSFTKEVSLTAENATVVASGALKLDASTVGTNLALTVGNGMTQIGALTVGGTLDVTLNTNKNQDVVLGDAGNNLAGKVTITNGSGTAQDVTITNTHSGSANLALPASLRSLTLDYANASVDLSASTLSGNLAVSAGKAITQSGALSVGGATTLTAAGQTVKLDTAGNDFVGAVSIVDAKDVLLADKNTLQLGISNVSHDLTVTTSGDLTQTGALTVAGTTTLDSGAASVVLDKSGNDFGGAVMVNNGLNVTLADKNALQLGKLAIGGNLDVTVNGDLTQSAAISIGAATGIKFDSNGSVVLDSFANDLTGKVTVSNASGAVQNVQLWNTHASASIGLPATVAGNLTLNLPNSAVALPSTAIGGALDVTAGGAITQGGALAVTGTSKLDAGANAVTLNDPANDFIGAVSIAHASDATLADKNGLILDSSSVSNNLELKTAGDITQIGVLTVTNTTKLDSSGNKITLDNALNDFGGAVTVNNASDVVFKDANGFKIGGTSNIGTLDVSAAGDITQVATTGVINVTGSTTLTVTGNTANIALADAANNLAGAVVAGTSGGGKVGNFALRNISATAPGNLTLPNIGGDLTLKFDSSPLTLGSPTTIKGNLDITTGGDITQNGALTVDGTSSFNAGAHAITLKDANTFTGGVTLINSGANDVSVSAAADLQINAATLGSGKLSVNVPGNLTETGIISQEAKAGAISITAGTVDLNKANQLNGELTLSSGNASLTNTAGLTLGAGTTVTGNLGLTLAGDLNQNGALNVTGTGLVTMTSLGNVTLKDAGNKLDGDLTIAGTIGDVNFFNTGAGGVNLLNSVHDLTLKTGGALKLAPVTVGGALDVNAAGGVSQSGAVTVVGTSKFDAGGNAIVLDQATNAFGGAVTIANAGDVTLVNAKDLTLGTSTISGKLNLKTVAGDILETGALTVSKATTLDAGTHSINFDKANNFQDVVSVTKAANVTLVDIGAVKLGSSDLSGNLDLTVGGDLTQVKDEALKVAGTSKITVDNHLLTNIKLADAANSLTGNVTVALKDSKTASIQDFELHNTASGAANLTLPTVGGNLKLQFDNSGVTLTGTTINGNLDIKTGGDIKQSGSLKVAGTAKFDAGAHGIKLDDHGNDFMSSVLLANSGGSEVSIADVNSLLFEGANVGSGHLTITAGGSVTQTGAIHQSGGGATISGSSISLVNGGNQFGGVLSLNGGSIDLVNSGGVTLGASSIGSNLSITAGGDINQTDALNVSGNASFISSGNNADILLGELPNSFSGSVTIGGTLRNVSLRNTSSAASTLQLPGTVHDLKLQYDNSGVILPTTNVTNTLEVKAGGDITQVGAVILPGTAKFDAGAHAIKLDSEGNDFGGAVTLANTGAHDVALTTSKGLILAESKLGSGAVSITAKGAISQTGTLTQEALAGKTSFTTGAATITLSQAGNDFTGAVGLNNSGDFNVVLNDTNALVLGASKLGDGSLSVTAHGDLTQTGGIVQGSKAKGASFEAGANGIVLGNSDNDFVGGVKLSNSGKHDVVLVDSKALQLDKVAVGSGTLTITGKGGITQGSTATNAITQEAAAGDARFVTETGAIVLDNKANLITGGVSIANTGSKDVTVVNSSAIKLSQVTLGSGALTISAQGNVTQGTTGTSDALVQAAGGGKVTINATGGAISLNNKLNDFTGAVTLNNNGANAVEVVDANALLLGASNLGTGTLTVTAGGAITQNGAITQAAGAGVASFKAGTTASGQAIILTQADNDFTGSVALSGGATQIVDKNALTLGTVATGNLSASSKGALSLGQGAVGGTLSANSGNGNISQSAALAVKGASTLNAGTGSITLTQANNDFNGVDVTAASASITASKALAISGTLSADLNTNSAALSFGNTKVGGNLASKASGAVTESGNLLVSGTASINAGSNAVTLDKANDFSSLAVTGAAVTVNDVTGINFGASNIGGKLTVTSGGAVGQLDSIVVSGTTSIDAGANAIVLDKANDFKDAVSLSNSGSNAVTLADVNSLKLGSVKTDGNLTVKSQGLSQDASGLKVGGNAVLDSGNGSMVLDSATNDFTGNVSLANSGANAVTLVDANALVLGAANLGSGALSVKAGGAITQSDVLKLAGSSSFDAGSNSVTLNRANEFGGEVKLTGGASEINAATAMKLNLATSGATKVSGTDVTISGSTTDLSLSTSGAVNQSAALKVSGTTALKAGGALDLSAADNDFAGAVTVDGGSGSLRTANDLKVTVANGNTLKFQAGKGLQLSGKAANLTTISGTTSQFGVTDVSGTLSIMTGGELTLATLGALNVPNLVLNLPLTQDLGAQALQFQIPNATTVTITSAHNGFIQIPTTARTTFVVAPGVGCIRVNSGGCVNGNAVISGAISAVQSGAVSGLVSKLAKEDALTKKLKYGFAGDLQQAQSYPHGGALEVKAAPAAGPADLVPQHAPMQP